MSELKFSIDNIREVATDSSDEFSYARIAVLSTRPNSHKVVITEDILRRDGASVLGKWIVCDFNGIDATTHTPQEVIVGIVPQNAKLDFITDKDGYVTLYVDAVISKIYAQNIYEMFKRDNFRNVSVEMLTKGDFELPNGNIEIDGLKIVGITILGKTVKGSCPNANMTITQFSEVNAEDYYNKVFERDEAKRLAKELIEFAEKISEKEFSQENLLNIESTDKEDTMLEEKLLSESAETVDTEIEDVVMDAEEEKAETEVEEVKEFAEAEDAKVDDEAQENEKEMAEPQEAEKEEEPKEDEKEMSEDEPQTEQEMACGEDEKEMAEDSETEEVEEQEEKSMSEQAVEFAESEQDKEFIGKVFSYELKDAVEYILSLKKFQDDRLAQDKANRLNAIMANVKEDLDAKQFAELQAEGEAIGLDDLDGFENKVKAFAYEASKTRRVESPSEDEVLTFASADIANQQAELTADDIYNKYL